MLDAVGIGDARTKRRPLSPTVISGFWRLRDPRDEARLLLLDEPAAGMTPAKARIWWNHSAGTEDFGLTILLIEHDMRL
jgi:ABC-type cobalamin transport system ATPase subunit